MGSEVSDVGHEMYSVIYTKHGRHLTDLTFRIMFRSSSEMSVTNVTWRQQQVGRVMLSAGFIGDIIVGPVSVPEMVKLTATAYCNFLKEVLDPGRMTLCCRF